MSSNDLRYFPISCIGCILPTSLLTCIIVTKIKEGHIGFIVDAVDEVIKIEKEDSDTAYIKNTIKQGLQDIETIVDTLNRLLPLIEPFGDAETIMELVLLYTEVVPNILLGDYDHVLEGLSEEAEEMARVAIKHRRKDMFAKLLEKYND